MRRETAQYLMPVKNKTGHNATYNVYPAHPIDEKIQIGYQSLAEMLSKEKVIILDGYIGVDWKEVIDSLTAEFKKQGKSIHLVDIKNYLKSESEIHEMVSPYLGADDPVFGTRTKLDIGDYFGKKALNGIPLEKQADLNIIFGCGASLLRCTVNQAVGWFTVYFDLPKNELQFRMRAGEITNLGFSKGKAPKQMYKHFYFVDWIVLNKAKKKLLPEIDIIVDQQRPNKPTWTTGEGLRNGLSQLSKSYFRVRPWFEPGVWGGQWIKENISGLNQEVPNYAWSFEMIVPENGLVFENEGVLLEVSFDMLMFHERENILGKAANRFQDEFPIRFDFLDTYDGGNLSVQCHPSPNYIKEHFGENFTQDETYYILDAEKDAEVYLGFQNGIDPSEFRRALEHSYQTKELLDVAKYVQKMPAKKHDLFLIPHSTIHCSGTNNMVLEISATPYIFTFKMYDWQRLDLEGSPRPLNIERAFKNLNFNRQGQVVQDTLISKPTVHSFGHDWKKVHLPTHPDHFYEIYRLEFEHQMLLETLDQCHVLMLVEGLKIELHLEESSQVFHYAETFAIPAATRNYRLINKGDTTAKVIVAFVKEEAC
jgi:mannose-6-phosphate isomerase class I